MKKLLLLIMTTLIVTSGLYVTQASTTPQQTPTKKLTIAQKRLQAIRIARLKKAKVNTWSISTWITYTWVISTWVISTWVICTWVDIIQKIDSLTWNAEYLYNTMIEYNDIAKDIYLKYQYNQNCYEYSKQIVMNLWIYSTKIAQYKKDYIVYLWKELSKVDAIIMDKQKTVFDESQLYKQCMYNNNIYDKNIDCGVNPEEYLQSLRDKSKDLYTKYQKLTTTK